MSEWIRVKERLPEQYEYVLVYAKMKGTDEPCPTSIARIMGDSQEWTWDFLFRDEKYSLGAWTDLIWDISSKDVTHWMPFPKPPEK